MGADDSGHRAMLGTVIYYITAPIRLFGRSRAFRWTLAGALVIGLFFGATLWTLDTFFPAAMPPQNRPALAALPPLPAATGQSTIVAPVAVALPAIRAALDDAAPREFAGKKDNALTQLLGEADMGVQVTRGPMQVAGQADALTITTPLNGAVHLTGTVGTTAGKVAGGLGREIGNLFGKQVGQTVGDLAGKPFDQKTEFRGNVVVTSRPVLAANWRVEPNLKGSLTFGESNINIAGIKLNLGNELKSLIDPLVNEQIARLQTRLRNDPVIERTVRREWEKMCRSLPLGGGKTGLPALWLEMKPVKAFAAQPKIDTRNVTLTIGVQAQTRVGPSQTTPQCPFPAQLDLLPRAEQGRLVIGVPIDVPFTEVNKLINAQLKGQVFGKEAGSAAEVEVRKATVAASGDRLLISLLVKAVEKKSWFGFAAEGTVHIWGKPALDAQKQILRLTDLSVAVESEAAYGLLGAAARAAIPYVQDALAESAVIDLKPFTADARSKIDAALGDFREVAPGVRAESAIDELRLVGIAFDSKTLRIITEATGRASVAVTELPH